MKILIVGYGSIGIRHVKNLLTFPKVDVIVFSRRAKKWNDLGVPVHSSLKECIDQKPDAAVIANVTSEHVKLANSLARVGIDLFIEKPLSHSMKDIDNLCRTIQRKNLITQIGCNFRFHECFKEIKRLLNKKTVGRVISVKVESGSYLPDWHPYEDYRKSYAARKELGGGVVLTCIHELDYLYWFFGKPTEVFSVTEKISDLNIEVEDLSAIILKFGDMPIAEIHLDYFQKPEVRSCKIIGTKGTIYWDSIHNIVKVFDNDKERWINKFRIMHYDRNSMYREELRHFLDCVKRRRKTINPIEDGIQTLRMALAVKRSSRMKKVLRI